MTWLETLRNAVCSEGGDWTTRRACSALAQARIDVSAERARLILNRLAEEGLLVKHGKRGRLWTPAVPPTVEYRIDFKVDENDWRFSSSWDDEDTARHRIAGFRTECPGSTWRLVEVTTRIIDQPEPEPGDGR